MPAQSAEAPTQRPYNRIPHWVKELAPGDCLTLGDFQSMDDGLSLQRGSKSYFIDRGDVLQVLEVIGGRGSLGSCSRPAVMCMTKSGPLPLSQWLVSNWFKLLGRADQRAAN